VSGQVRRASVALLLAFAGAGLLAGRASAHAGLTAPAATSYLARISSVPAGVEAKVVDGDQRLWLRVPPGRTLVVTGLRGEPYLRFSARGVEVNTRSATSFLNRARPSTVPRGLGPRTPPAWKLLTRGHSTSWHEDRLHALALVAHPAGERDLGRWFVPVLVDGHPTGISGALRWAPRPSLLWFWPLALLLACVPALLRLGDAGLARGVSTGLTAPALGASTLARLGRELYGRPTVSPGQLVLVGLTCAVALALALLWWRKEWRTVAGVLIGVAAAYQGLALVGTLRNPFVLAALPDWLERAAASLALAGGVALLLVTVTSPRSYRASAADAEESRREALLGR
jgi:hypothetical protein